MRLGSLRLLGAPSVLTSHHLPFPSFNRHRTSHAAAYQTQINQFLATQGQRLEAASLADRKKREELSRKRQLSSVAAPVANAAASSSQAPSLSLEAAPLAPKRRKLNPGVDLLRAFGAANLDPNANLAATPVATDYPLQVVVDGLIKTLEAVPEAVLSRAIDMVRMQLPPSELRPNESEPDVAAPTSATDDPRLRNAANMETEGIERSQKLEEAPRMVDPLKLDLGDEELSIKAEVPPEPTASRVLSPAFVYLFL